MARVTDHRDSVTWIVLELTSAGEALAEEGQLESHLRKELTLPDEHQVFVPYTVIVRHGRKSVINVIEGYAFVATGLPDTTYFRLANTANVKKILFKKSSSGMNIITPVPDSSVKDLQRRLREMISREIEVGTEVRVHEGLHTGLVGKVIDSHGDDAFVMVKLRTIETVRVFPRYILRPAEGVLGFDSPSEVYPAYEGGEDG
jgi:transcription antitermination factor NusG